MRLKKDKFRLPIVLLIAGLFALPLEAQVNIGSDDAPQPFSVLELTTTLKQGGIRLPQLTTAERNALDLTSYPDAAKGLVIYNTDIDCIEYWTRDRWVTLCNDKPDFVFTNHGGNPNNTSDLVDPAATSFPVAGETRGPFVPHDNPECTDLTTPYTLSVKIGDAYTHITITDPATGEFTIKMDPNTSGGLRYAVITIKDNCMEAGQDFIFTQNGN